jgi:hypothetical protein
LLQSDQLTLTSIYRPFNGETPGIVLVGFTGKGSRMLLAREAGALLAATSMPTLAPWEQTPNSTAQTAFGLPLEKILGPAQWAGGALSFSFISPKAVTNEETELPSYMGFETHFYFQSERKEAKVYGQWVLSQKEAPGVIESLMKNHIGIMDTHSALLDLSPPQVFINFWAEGEPIKIAKVLKEALGKTQLAGWTPSNAPEAQQP